MSRESKIIECDNGLFEQKEIIWHYECFGWELLSCDESRIVMTRETQNEKIGQLNSYENQYENLLNNLRLIPKEAPLKKLNGLAVLILLLVFVFPAILYITYILVSNNKIRSNNELLRIQKEEYKKKINEVCSDSRKLFFGR